MNPRLILLATMLFGSVTSLRGQSHPFIPRFSIGIGTAVPISGSLFSEHIAGADIYAGFEFPLPILAVSLTASAGFTHFFQSTSYASEMHDIRSGISILIPVVTSVTVTLAGNVGIAYTHENFRMDVANEVGSESVVHTMPLIGGGLGVQLYEHFDVRFLYSQLSRVEAGTMIRNGLMEISLGYML